jgi:hypothetical protein
MLIRHGSCAGAKLHQLAQNAFPNALIGGRTSAGQISAPNRAAGNHKICALLPDTAGLARLTVRAREFGTDRAWIRSGR